MPATSETTTEQHSAGHLPFFPYRYMAVDVGSNSIKYRIWEIEQDGGVRQLCEQRYPVRLGSGVFTAGMLGEEATRDTVDAFRKIKSDFTNQQVHAMRAVATSAMREASDGLTVVRQIHKETGITLEILPAAEEARMIALGALGTRPALPAGQHVLIDIGGGSTEVIIAREPDIVLAESVRLGAVRLKEWFFPEVPPQAEQIELAEQHIHDVIGKVLHVPQLDEERHGLGVAGTITALAQMIRAQGTEETVATAGDMGLTLAQLEEMIGDISKLTLEAITQRYELDARRAEIILPGALILRALMRLLKLEHLTLVRGGVGDGMLQDFLERAGLRRSRLFDHNRAFHVQALALGEHYHFNRQHAEQVARLAASLFDQLQPLDGLSATDRMLLVGAALLHEIGQYVSFAAHHKHSYYLIMHADLPGLSEVEKVMLACIARYHRKSHPKPRHEGYEILAPAERECVRKLAAILRLADAFDREHQSLVSHVQVEIKPKVVEFHVATHYKAAVEIWNARQKATLFEEVYRRKVEFYTMGI
jgi:exopolyphosphatase/guanosine-5'-triphosphate,3'-diphosphate pyrophosphatase